MNRFARNVPVLEIPTTREPELRPRFDLTRRVREELRREGLTMADLERALGLPPGSLDDSRVEETTR